MKYCVAPATEVQLKVGGFCTTAPIGAICCGTPAEVGVAVAVADGVAVAAAGAVAVGVAVEDPAVGVNVAVNVAVGGAPKAKLSQAP